MKKLFLLIVSLFVLAGCAPNIQMFGTPAEQEDAFGDLKILGKVQNIGNKAADFVKINFTFYDASSNVIGTDYTYIIGAVLKLKLINMTTNTALKPQDIGAFMLWTNIKKSDVARYDYSFECNADDLIDPNAKLEMIGDVLTEKDYFGDLNLSGKVKNTGTQGLAFGMVYFLIKNRDDILINIDYDYISGETITLPSIENTTDTALNIGKEGTVSVMTSTPFEDYFSSEIKYDWMDMDIVSGIGSKVQSQSQTVKTKPLSIADKKFLWKQRNKEIEQSRESIGIHGTHH